MANIIIAWEYERDLTHILRLVQLQQSLREMGHKVYLIGANSPALENLADLSFLPAPRAPAPVIHKPRAVIKIGGFGDRLALMGFNNAKNLHALVTTWDHYFDLLKPQLLISDCAPVANLAAWQRIPCIQLSDGFSLPPTHLEDFPRLRPDAPPLATSQSMLENIDYVQTQRKQATPCYLPEILQSEYTFVAHLSEFDPYLRFRQATKTTTGPYRTLPPYRHNNRQKHYFACLDMNYADAESIIIGLTDVDTQGVYFIPEASTNLREFLASDGHIVLTQFPILSEIFIECTTVIHHGNALIAEAAMAAGIPQVSLPFNFENEWTSNTLSNLKVGCTIIPKAHPLYTTAEAVRYATKQSVYREWAALRAQHFKQQPQTILEPAIHQACQTLL